MEISIARCNLEAQGIVFSNILRTIGRENSQKLPWSAASFNFHRLVSSHQTFTAVYPRRSFFCRTHSMATSLEGFASASLQSGDDPNEDMDPSTDSEDESLSQPNTSEQALARLAEEIAKSGIPNGSRKINGKYIHTHLVARLKAVHEQLTEQIKDVDVAQSKEVSVFWAGMAESVQVMGSFDGWSQGEHLSPEYTGSYTRFSTTLMLRPGRYEVKFFVDGEWHLSPELPVTGEGLMKNNLLIVE
ncbi:unnamed protein product [Trifolium pratense]|uniref:Uncharacterized protein n=1 Tax=Trifolium pratense TaxID=57577 RepID=A0ACB0J994_TRIPR|nr:unnamed protein product [Trifolium pratense]